MVRPLTIKNMHILAESHEGKCLSIEYKNVNTKLLWRCKEGHKWKTTPMVVKKGSWCPTCARQKSIKARSLSLKAMKDLAKQFSGKCLSEQYINNKTKLLWECKESHQWESTPKIIKQGFWCRECNKKKRKFVRRYTVQDMQKIAHDRQGKCLSKEYRNSKSKILWGCNKGHRWEAIPYSVLGQLYH